MNLRLLSIYFVVIVTSLLHGCRAPVPVQPGRSTSEVVADVRARTDRVSRFAVTGSATLTGHGGKRVSLDTVLIAQNTGMVRLRTYKMGSAAFDLTILPDAVWVWQSRRLDQPIDIPAFTTADLPLWTMLVGGLPESMSGRAVRKPDHIAWIAKIDDGEFTTMLDPDSAVVTSYIFARKNGQRHAIELDRYRMVGEVAWPGRVRVLGQQGEIVIRLSNIEIDPDLPGDAFTPPSGAVRQGSVE